MENQPEDGKLREKEGIFNTSVENTIRNVNKLPALEHDDGEELNDDDGWV